MAQDLASHSIFQHWWNIGSGRTIKDLRWIDLLLLSLAIFTISRLIKLWNSLRGVSFMPGLRVPFMPLALPGAAIPTLWWNPGLDFPWLRRFDLYQTFNSETISVVPFIFGKPNLYTSNLDVARQVVATGIRSSWIKPETASQALLLWGMNLAAAEKETWRRHRRIMGPSFNSKTYNLVWEETVKTYHDMVAGEGWTGKQVINVPVVQKLTFKLALLVLSACGFGIPFEWTSPPTAPDGSMSVQEALRIVTSTSTFSISVPKWVMKLPIGWIREVRTAHATLDSFMLEQVAKRRNEVRALLESGEADKTRKDVFSMLVKANEEVNDKYPLEDTELIGNVFLLLFAGHETSAHTLAATLGFLSVQQDIQNEVFDQIMQVVGPDREPIYGDYDSLDKVLAAFHEGVRMFPAGSVLIRETTEDTVLNIPNPVGKAGNNPLAVPKGVQVVVDMVGIQYNPRYFPDPGSYKPSRWYANKSQHKEGNEADGFTAFSIGPRECLGRKFATTEAVAFLTLLLRDFRVVPALLDGETEEEWRARVMQAKMLLTLSILPVPLKLVRRRGL